MNTKEYDQKKQECWENFKFARRSLNTDKKVFDYIFDRAYALGKEKETISQEEIEKASVEFADREYEIGQVDWDALYKGYSHGMKDSIGKQEKDAEKTVTISKEEYEELCRFDRYINKYVIGISKCPICGEYNPSGYFCSNCGGDKNRNK